MPTQKSLGQLIVEWRKAAWQTLERRRLETTQDAREKLRQLETSFKSDPIALGRVLALGQAITDLAAIHREEILELRGEITQLYGFMQLGRSKAPRGHALRTKNMVASKKSALIQNQVFDALTRYLDEKRPGTRMPSVNALAVRLAPRLARLRGFEG
jgi:hypothetical protein